MESTINKRINIICVSILLTLLFATSIINILNLNHESLSIAEKRKLKEFPRITKELLMSGDYIKEFDEYIADNFVSRNRIINFSDILKQCYSINHFLPNDALVFLDNNFVFSDEPKEEEKIDALNENTEEMEKITEEANKIEINVDNNEIHKEVPYAVRNQAIDASVNDMHLQGSYILYKGLPYFTGYSSSDKYRESIAMICQFKEKFPNSTVTVMPVPTKAAFIDDINVTMAIGNQGYSIDHFLSLLPQNILGVKLYDTLKEHLNEYIYYYSDHHWTALGAYYGYVEYCKKRGLKPYELSHFKQEFLTDNYVGTAFSYTNDIRVSNLKDTVYCFRPQKKCKMTNYCLNGKIVEYDDCIVTENNGYYAFIGGDSLISVIKVEGNEDKNSLLLVKDSFANALAPFLVEHYKKIIIVDPRYMKENMTFRFSNLDYIDILFTTHFFTHSVSTWPMRLRYLLNNLSP